MPGDTHPSVCSRLLIRATMCFEAVQAQDRGLGIYVGVGHQDEIDEDRLIFDTKILN